MYFENLREYVEALEKAGQLKRIRTQVSVDLEIAEILRRVMYDNDGPAVLFENVEGYDIPVLGNAFGSLRRLKMALDMENFEDIGERVTELTRLKMPHGLLNKFKMLPKLSEISDYGPKSTTSGPVTEIIEMNN
ncbi:MAG TPA: menaquinone biosynthesis decarboxylase, partial [Nitrososphaeraceae archaeon]|nr:menaquinone biosynthesis decarboxylase [Nitrososphaeraceae archaeon]